MKVFLLTISLGGILAMVMFGFLADWDPSYMSFNGWIALMLCTIFTLGVGGGLMALVFHSARHGYDDQIEVDVPPSDPE
ncbi:MAG: hypothetical protein JSS00_11455 [Proteobacteria bacterium]|nr:hypothetical protein [Pseudomonadota bacterium]